MYIITLNNGAEFPAEFCSARGQFLTLKIRTGLDFVSVAQIFTAHSQTVTFHYDSTSDQYEGFTQIVAINRIIANDYLITMRKEE